jgi:hypothetical protein
MIRAPDAASIASMLWLEALIGRKPGASTGTNLWKCFSGFLGNVAEATE